MKQQLIVIMSVAALAGCATNVPNKTAETTTVSAKAEDTSLKIPDWYLDTPQVDGSMMSVGTALSPDLQLSYDIAVLNAKAGLADRLKSKIDSQTKSFQSQIGTNENLSTRQEAEKAIKNKVVDVDLAGYRVARKETIKEKHLYRTFVMLEYNDQGITSANQTELQKKIFKESGLTQSERAFKELDSNKAQ